MFFSQLKLRINEKRSPEGKSVFILAEDAFDILFRCSVASIPFDEAFYLARYPDVDLALKLGELASAHDHYIEFGYREGRLPFRLEVDVVFYRRKYPDVAAAVDGGLFESEQEHYNLVGRDEGRLPYDGFRLFDIKQQRDATAETTLCDYHVPVTGKPMERESLRIE